MLSFANNLAPVSLAIFVVSFSFLPNPTITALFSPPKTFMVSSDFPVKSSLLRIFLINVLVSLSASFIVLLGGFSQPSKQGKINVPFRDEISSTCIFIVSLDWAIKFDYSK